MSAEHMPLALGGQEPRTRNRRLLWTRIRLVAPYVVGTVMTLVAAWVLHASLADHRYQGLTEQLAGIGWPKILASIVLTAASFVTLATYEHVGLMFAGRPLPWRRAALAAFVSQAIAHTTGFAVLVGGTLRFQIYGSQGLSVGDVAKVQIFFSSTFALAMTVVTAIALLAEPRLIASATPLPPILWSVVGALMLAAVAAYLLWGMFLHRPIAIWGHRFVPPTPRVTITQIVLGAIDLAFAAAALWVLMPPALELSFPAVLVVFVLAVIVGIVSHVPGGLGVFESAVVLLIRPPADQTLALISALVVYRLVYYLLPFLLGALILACVEARRWRMPLEAATRQAVQWAGPAMPMVNAVLCFGAGVVLLASAATPSDAERLRWLGELVPLAAIEIAHVGAAMAGLLLLALARPLVMRVAAAWSCAALLVALGVALSVLKGLDVEEAAALVLVLFVLLPSRREFYRQVSLLDEHPTTGWLAAIAAALAGSAWLMVFAYRHVEFNNRLLWQAELLEQAPRAWRTAMAVGVLALAFAAVQLFRPRAPRPSPASAQELARALPVVRASPNAASWLALTGDKALLFHESGEAFLMYAVKGRSWIVLGEPVGPERHWPDLVWRFHTLADRQRGRTVFYGVLGRNLGKFPDLGLTPVKLGEKVTVDLMTMGAGGGLPSAARQADLAFEVLPPEAVPHAMDELRRVSDEWLAEHRIGERSVSTGSFDARYLACCPVAVALLKERIVGFANLWPGGGVECSVDLMRFGRDAPEGAADYLLACAMMWARAAGYRSFDLGLAPLPGPRDYRLAPLWPRLGWLLFRHGEQPYNPQALRALKATFDPSWQSVYVLAPRLALWRAGADVASLLAEGWGGTAKE